MRFVERFLPIANYPGYEVSDMGRVRNRDGKFLKPNPHYKGELRVRLYNNEGWKDLRVHRLVAIAFIPNPKNLPVVDHRNENKGDNRISNLVWTDGATNTRRYFGIETEVRDDIPF